MSIAFASPAVGTHIKLLDGLWFAVDGRGSGPTWRRAGSTRAGGTPRTDYAAAGGVRMSRTDVVPDGPRALLVGLTFSSESAQRVPLTLAAHCELMAAYPWGESTPSQLTVNAPDTGSVQGGMLVVREQVGAEHPLGTHDWATVVGSAVEPVSSELGPTFAARRTRR